MHAPKERLASVVLLRPMSFEHVVRATRHRLPFGPQELLVGMLLGGRCRCTAS